MDGMLSRILAKPRMLGVKTDDTSGDFIFTSRSYLPLPF